MAKRKYNPDLRRKGVDPNLKPKVERYPNGQLKKGSILNPGGAKPKEMSMTHTLRAMGEIRDQKHPETGELITKREMVCYLFWLKACEGDVQAAQQVFSRLDGTPRQTHEITGASGSPIPVMIVKSEDAADNGTPDSGA